MRKIYQVNALPDVLTLGVQTEHGVLEILFDCTLWLELWPDLTMSVWVRPPGGGDPYPADVLMDGRMLVWAVSAADTAVAGRGSVEILGVANGRKKLSATTKTLVEASGTDINPDPPAAYQAWVESVALNAAAAQRAAGESEAAEGRAAAAAEGAEKSQMGAVQAEALASMRAAEALVNAQNAAEFAGRSKLFATLAEQSAATHGFFYTYIGNDGHLHYVRSDGLMDLKLRLENGRLIASYGMERY